MFFAISFKGQDSPFQSSMSEDNPAVPNTAPSQLIMLHQFFFFNRYSTKYRRLKLHKQNIKHMC